MTENKMAECMKAKVRGEMPQDELRQRIMDHIGSQTMCVIATCDGKTPRATPIEYYSEDLTLYMTIDPGVKLDNLKNNPVVSVGICNQIHPDWANGKDWSTVKSAQITGNFTFLDPGTNAHKHALKVYKYWIFAEACGLDPEIVIKDRIIGKIEPVRIEYMEFGLKMLGYGSRQTLDCLK